MFLGTHAPKLDDKGRVILPARFREGLANGLVLTRGQERCIYVFTAQDFDAHLERLREAPLTSKRAGTFCVCSSPARHQKFRTSKTE
jgi:Uncharacterized protein conserved in bacteria